LPVEAIAGNRVAFFYFSANQTVQSRADGEARDKLAEHRSDFGAYEKPGSKLDWVVPTATHRLMMATANRTMAKN
jgi:hypothetical protein